MTRLASIWCVSPSFLVLIQGTYGTRLPAPRLLDHLRSSVVTNSLIAAAVGMCLTVLVSTNLSRPLTHIIGVRKGIREGYLEGIKAEDDITMVAIKVLTDA